MTIKRITLTLLLIFGAKSFAQTSISYNTKIEPITYAANKFAKVMALNNESIVTYHSSQLTDIPNIGIVVLGDSLGWKTNTINPKKFEAIEPEGYEFRQTQNGEKLLILAIDEVGAMYGLLDLTEQVQVSGSYKIPSNKKVNPSLEYRVIKFNLPWSPYRKSKATAIHMQTCRDLAFWEKFLDMMAENRLNVLSLWNNHPFPYLIKAANFPEATPLNDKELVEWQQFWKALFRMAKQRGVQTFLVNWNIVVSPEFAKAYDAKEYNDLSDKVKKYTKESVTQIINEYEDLTGFGVTLADWMGNFEEVEMDPQKREDWIEDTYVAGMKAANRPVKFLHRSVLAGDPLAMRKVINGANLESPALVEIKFNWSHGHSTPNLAITHDYHSGRIDNRFWEPKPKNYDIQWMIRNEDFFILRWGEPDFIREHMRLNKGDFTNGYFIGSEGYIPAVDYSQKSSPTKTWHYAFEKQWLFYKVWGRLLYEADTPDKVFSDAFEIKYGKGIGSSLIKAYKLASKMPLRLASFHRSTWDYTLYAEGFIEAEPSSPDGFFDRTSPFISIDELIYHETLEPSFLSIPDYLNGKKSDFKKWKKEKKITPLELANASETDSKEALKIAGTLRKKLTNFSGALASELDDITTWGYLGLYFSDKLRAGVALEKYRRTGDITSKQDAIRLLEKCLEHWNNVVAYTKNRYKATPHVNTERWDNSYEEFSWELMQPQVVRDIEIAKSATIK